MKNKIYFLAMLLLAWGCTESPEPDPAPKAPEAIDISEILQGHDPVGAGQKVTLEAKLAEILPSARFEWTGTHNGEALDNLNSGGQNIHLFTKRGTGEYTINLKATSGERTGTLSKKITVVETDFEFGMWANSKKIITDSEELNGNSTYEALIGMPEPYSGAGQNRIVYQRSSTWHIAYYFDGDKLKGGGTYKSGDSRSSIGDFIWYQGYYKQDQKKINDRLGVQGKETITWTVPADRQNQYLNQSNGQGVSLAVENGHATVSTLWDLDGIAAKLDLKRAYQSGSAISYTVYKK